MSKQLFHKQLVNNTRSVNGRRPLLTTYTKGTRPTHGFNYPLCLVKVSLTIHHNTSLRFLFVGPSDPTPTNPFRRASSVVEPAQDFLFSTPRLLSYFCSTTTPSVQDSSDGTILACGVKGHRNRDS